LNDKSAAQKEKGKAQKKRQSRTQLGRVLNVKRTNLAVDFREEGGVPGLRGKRKTQERKPGRMSHRTEARGTGGKQGK